MKDDLLKMSPVELIEFALKTEDMQTFWLTLGVLCASLEKQQREEASALWMTAYTEPEEESAALARQLLRKLHTKLGKEAL